ncbi:unnamed protein product [Linum trigynum]|uniref:Uncharacterized protein n=1 Tax=Linum trigynum TaxID=586398 RepID=A0AAV2DW05_9ROSI
MDERKQAELPVELQSDEPHVLCARSEEYHRVSGCKSAKEIWDKLQVAHEGTTHVKISRINRLKQEFESFVMKPEETIKEMHDRFTTIVNSLRNLDVEYSSADLVRKVLWALPKRWTPKVTAIEESKDLTKLSLDELMGSLVTHEEKLKREGEEVRKEKKSIAFKVSASEEELDCLEDMEDEELAMLSKHVAKLLRLRREKKKGGFLNRTREGDPEKEQLKKFRANPRVRRELISNDNKAGSSAGCFKCGRCGHIKVDRPQMKREKAYTAT